jgi:hypothetical protein
MRGCGGSEAGPCGGGGVVRYNILMPIYVYMDGWMDGWMDVCLYGYTYVSVCLSVCVSVCMCICIVRYTIFIRS